MSRRSLKLMLGFLLSIFLLPYYLMSSNAAHAAPATTSLILDDFSRGLSNWTKATNVSIESGKLSLDHDGYVESTTGSGWSDFTFETDVEIKESAAGINFRLTDDNNYYMWQLNSAGNKLRPHKKVNGTFTLLKEVPYTFQLNTKYRVKIAAEGSTISTYINDTLIDTTTDTTFASGRIGFRQYSDEHAHVDNIHVYVQNPVLLADSFDSVLSNWSSSNAAIESGELSLDHNAYAESKAGSHWSDVSFESNVTIKEKAAGILFRLKDDNNYYMWQLSSSDHVLRAHKKVDGQFTVIKEVPYAFQLNTSYQLTIVTAGPTIQTFINGNLIETTMDQTFKAGKIGFRQYVDEHAYIDDVVVYATNPQAGIVATPFLLKGQSSVNNVKLQWQVPNATHYELYRSVNHGSYSLIQSLTGTTVDDYNLANGNSYRYSVKAFSGATVLKTAYSSLVTPFAKPSGLKTFDNSATSNVELPNPLKIGNTYYRFNYVSKSETGRLDSFKELVMQTSTDDLNYGNDTVVMHHTDHADLEHSRLEGLTIVYHEATNKFILWAHYEDDIDYSLARLAVAYATPGQSFTFSKSFRPMNEESRDMSMFRDEDGTAYIVSSANGNADLHLYKLTANWLDVARQEATIYTGLYREAPHIVKKDGHYYLFTSQTAGWYPSTAMYSSASSLTGDWSPLRMLGNTSTFSAQSGWLVSMKPSDADHYAMIAPRWMFGWQDAVNPNFEERMLPLSFSNGFAFFDYYDNIQYDGNHDVMIPVQDGKILSQGKSAANSSNTTDADQVNDGDYYSSWVGETTWPSSWTIDLGQSYSLSDIQISWFMHPGSEAYYRYKVEGSSDGANYSMLLDRTSGYNDYGFTAHSLSGTARYVRVTMTDAVIWNNTTNWYTPQLYEVKVLGQ